jgi:DNA-binding beta-propeller fold protein YncE
MRGPLKLSTRAAVAALVAASAACAEPQASESAAMGAMPLFQADAAWPTPPADFEWGQVIGIFADAGGHVWTSSRSQIQEWDPRGNLLQSWDARGPDGNWSTIHGMFVDHNDFVWTTARESNLVLKFTRDGQLVMTVGRFDETGGSNHTELMGRPSEIWVDPANNEAYIADGYGNRRVIVIDGETGAYLRHWGAYGRRPEDPAGGGGGGGGGRGGGQGEAQPQPVPEAPPQQFRTVHGIAGSRDGLIYVADRANNRVQVFRKNGEYLMERILRPHCGVEEQATWVPDRPCGNEAAFSVGFSPDAAQQFLYVADGGSHMITVLRRSDLEILYDIGGPGVGVGQMGRPHNLTVDPQGNIFVAEAAGPTVIHPVTGDSVAAGYRAQKFTFTGLGSTP